MNWLKPESVELDSIQMIIIGMVLLILALCVVAVGQYFIEKIRKKPK
jgi:hypothetical protein